MTSRPKVDGAKIAALRSRKKIDQTELATRLRANHGLGATQATISRWENGQEPRAYALPALAVELGCSIEDLYASDDDEEESASMPLSRDEYAMLGHLMSRLGATIATPAEVRS